MSGSNVGSRVYAYVTTLDNWPKWRSDVVEVELLTEVPMRVGSQARGVGKVFGRPFTIDMEVTSLEAGAKCGYKPISGPLRTNNLSTFEGRAGGTLIILTDEIRLTGIFRVLEPPA